MARPPKGRFIGRLPRCTLFRPVGGPPDALPPVSLGPDEMEALRLKDLEGLDGDRAAQAMGVSRATFQRILEQARRRLVQAVFEGRDLEIRSGLWAIRHREDCPHCEKRWYLPPWGGAAGCPGCDAPAVPHERREESLLKIAVVSDDGEHISQHFGWAPYYVVVTVENGEVVAKEVRSKAGHHQEESGHHHHHHDHGHGHEHGHHDHALHGRMASNIRDCSVVIAGGMGQGAYASLSQAGLKVHITDQRDIDTAVRRYLDGNLPNLLHRLH